MNAKNTSGATIDDVTVRILSYEPKLPPQRMALGYRLLSANFDTEKVTLHAEQSEQFVLATWAYTFEPSADGNHVHSNVVRLGSGRQTRYLPPGQYKVRLGIAGRDCPETVETIEVLVTNSSIGISSGRKTS